MCLEAPLNAGIPQKSTRPKGEADVRAGLTLCSTTRNFLYYEEWSIPWRDKNAFLTCSRGNHSGNCVRVVHRPPMNPMSMVQLQLPQGEHLMEHLRKMDFKLCKVGLSRRGLGRTWLGLTKFPMFCWGSRQT